MRAEAVRLCQGRGAHTGMSLREKRRAMAFAVRFVDMIEPTPDFKVKAVEIVFIGMFSQQLIVHSRQTGLADVGLGDDADGGGAVIGLDDKGVGDGLHVALPFFDGFKSRPNKKTI